MAGAAWLGADQRPDAVHMSRHRTPATTRDGDARFVAIPVRILAKFVREIGRHTDTRVTFPTSRPDKNVSRSLTCGPALCVGDLHEFDGCSVFLEDSMTRFARYAFTTLMLALLAPALAFAQASRTWVSGVGNDADPCSRTAPCKTFAGAISKTAPFGEISVLDPGGYGGVTITKSITINGDGTLASSLVSGTNAIVINAAATDTVIIRNLSLFGVNTGLSAIKVFSAGHVIIENCAIYGFTANNIEVNSSSATTVDVRNTSITGATVSGSPVGQAVAFNGTGAPLTLSLRDVTIKGTTFGVHAVRGTTNISHSIIANASSFGVLSDTTSTITISDSTIFNNGVGVQAQAGTTLRITGNSIFDNGTNLGCGAGALLSAGDNRVGGGGAGCAPTGAITVQ